MNYYERREVSNSDLSALKRELTGDERDPSAAYAFGRLVDCMITEPLKVDFYNLTCDGETCSEDDFHAAYEMKKAFLKDEECRKLLSISETQKVMIDPCKHFDYVHPFSLPVRCKWDFWIKSWGGDLKSTSATTLRQFREAARHFDYDRQRYFYMNISNSERDMLVGVSKVNYQVFKIRITRGDDFWKSGKHKCNELAFKYYLLFGEL
jgi:hypothetical protein